MSDYHSADAFNARRLMRPTPITQLRVFYHISCMNNWHEVVLEQFKLMKFAGIKEATSCILGSIPQALWCIENASYQGIELTVHSISDDFQECEHPTLCRMFDWCVKNPSAGVLYLHTKGVSNPADSNKKHWRRVMQKPLFENLQHNIELLADCDAIGSNWMEGQPCHFCGNFWMARADWIANLDHPLVYMTSKSLDDRYVCGHPWRRMHVEMWLGSKNWHHLHVYLGRNWDMWSGAACINLPQEIEGFKYDT